MGVDFNPDMIKIAEDKIKKKKIKNICFKIEDAMNLVERQYAVCQLIICFFVYQ